MNQSSYEVLLLENILAKKTWTEKHKITFLLKTAVCEDMMWWLSPGMNGLLEKFYFEFLHALSVKYCDVSK